MFDETQAQKDGTTKRNTCFPDTPEQWILSGPHFSVGLPLYKTPKSVCNTKNAYDLIEITNINDNYLPRSNYISACKGEEYQNSIPSVSWIEETESKLRKITEYYRLIFRNMLNPNQERTLIGAIIIQDAAHINSCISYSFSKKSKLHFLLFSSLSFSLVYDFFIKITGKTNLGKTLDDFPVIYGTKYDVALIVHCLTLTCLTTHYAELWETTYTPEFNRDTWTKQDPRLNNQFFHNLTPNWQRNVALRTDYERRQALVEIDVLAAMALGLTLDELITIYRVQFPVMRQYEKDTWYDQNGRIVFTSSKGLPGVGFPRKAKKGETGWEDIKDMKTGTVERTIENNTLPGGSVTRTIVYEAPFDKCDREEDYRIAWAAFEQRFANQEVQS